MPTENDVELDGATPAVSDNEAPPPFVSISGLFKNKKRKLIQSRTEYLRENLSLVDSSSRTLGLSKAVIVTDCDDDQPGEGSLSIDSTTSVTSSTDPPQALTANTTPTPAPSSRAFGIASHNGLAQTTDGPTLEGMRIFDQGIDEETRKRFYDVCEQLEPALISFLHKKRVEFRPLGIQVLVLGHSPSAAKPWIVVRCGSQARRKAKSFFKKDFARSLCQGPPSCRVRFEVKVTTQVQLKNGESLDEVLIKEEMLDTPGIRSPCIKVEHSGIAYYATMGGFVSVTYSYGRKSFYGLTAGHVLPANKYDEAVQSSPKDDSDDDSEGEDSDDVGDDDSESDGNLSRAGNIANAQQSATSIPKHTNKVSDAQDGPEWATLGAMIEASYSTRARDRDWALIDITGAHRKHSGSIELSCTSMLEGVVSTDERCMVVHNKSRLECVMSPLPSRMLLPSGHKFVDMHVLQLRRDIVLPRGSSGSWVMNADQEACNEVYGSLVATDSLGGLWMVPMADILKDIRDELEATDVKLSSYVGRAEAEDEAGLRYAMNTDLYESDVDLSGSEDEWTRRGKNKERLYNERKLFGTPSIPEQDSKYSPTSSWLRRSQTGPSHHYEDDGVSQVSKLKSSKVFIWHCGHCGDGPYGGWQYSCQNCGYNDRA